MSLRPSIWARPMAGAATPTARSRDIPCLACPGTMATGRAGPLPAVRRRSPHRIGWSRVPSFPAAIRGRHRHRPEGAPAVPGQSPPGAVLSDLSRPRGFSWTGAETISRRPVAGRRPGDAGAIPRRKMTGGIRTRWAPWRSTSATRSTRIHGTNDATSIGRVAVGLLPHAPGAS
jgi:hypothetical protein